MTEQAEIGVDLNGLRDAIAVGWPAIVRRGPIPSVLVPVRRPHGAIDVFAGLEASSAFEGRGWQWPAEARDSACRLPVADVLHRLQAGSTQLRAGDAAPADLLAAAVDALAGPSLAHGSQEIVLAVPDNQKIGEDIRQALLDAFVRRRRHVTLLWRSVAAFLGVEPKLRPHTEALVGRRVGLISVDAGAIEATAFDIEAAMSEGIRYLVPVRCQAGVRVTFPTSLFDRALALATSWLPEDEASGRQLVWGNGLAIKRLLGLAAGPALIQRNDEWSIIEGNAPVTGSLPQLSSSDIDALNRMIDGCVMVIFEGPGLYARDAAGTQLVHYVRAQLHARQVFFEPPERFYAAEGCSAFSWRKMNRWRTYSDFLPQLQISVRVEGNARFLALIPPEARVEGGGEYKQKIDLGFVLRKDAISLKVYLVKERETRFASIELPAPPEDDVPIGIDVVQKPAQGRARLTLVPLEGRAFAPLEMDWRSMVVDPRDEVAILADLNSSAGRVPLIVPIKPHPLLWTFPIQGESLVDLLRDRPSTLTPIQLRAHLARVDSPWRMTGRVSSDRALYRAIGTDGAVPGPEDGIPATDVGRLDRELERLADTPGGTVACSWAFARCPRSVVERLRDLTRTGTSSVGEVNGMGRVFTEDHQFDALFSFLTNIPEFKQHHILALLSVLSLREDAARRLKPFQAEAFTKQALRVLSVELRARNFERRCRATIKLVAALLRNRLNNPQFLAPGSSDLARRVEATLERIRKEARNPRVVRLAVATLEFLHDQGTDATILEYEPEDD